MPGIALPSVQSLLLRLIHNGHTLSSATGFVVSKEGTNYLVTNRHVVTGLHQHTGEPLSGSGATPQFVEIWHNCTTGVGSWVRKTERLYDYDIRPRWLEHPELREKADLVALPLSELDQAELFPYDPWQTQPDVALRITGELSIVGFPFGLTGGGLLAIWSRGSIATEPEIDYENMPMFLIDSRTRQGQSGSPVIYFNPGGVVPMADGTLHALGETRRFLGVYSGRINQESDLGFVWKQRAVQEVVSRGARPS